ncbi:MAG: hypothetical protein JMDDDDMK_03453 [Acidobacteria bacterium]|nr:hypothetical protein [Acidobacteriota bacterium]
MTSQAEVLSSVTPARINNGWVIGMPKEIADAFGVTEGSMVTLFAQPGSVTAMMNLATQTDEARNREPGWFIEMPPEMAAAVGVADNTFIGIYAKSGALWVEMLPPPSPDFKAIIDEILDKNKVAFEELKRLGD